MMSFDLRSGYHNIAIHPGSETFLDLHGGNQKTDPVYGIFLRSHHLACPAHSLLFTIRAPLPRVDLASLEFSTRH